MITIITLKPHKFCNFLLLWASKFFFTIKCTEIILLDTNSQKWSIIIPWSLEIIPYTLEEEKKQGLIFHLIKKTIRNIPIT